MPSLQTNVWQTTSHECAHPGVEARVDKGWTRTGGGAQANWSGSGSLLVGTYPVTPDLTDILKGTVTEVAVGTHWSGKSKDHEVSDPSTLTASAIGVRLMTASAGSLPLPGKVFVAVSAGAAHPEVTVTLPDGWVATGGGALAVYGDGAGSLLTDTSPVTGASGSITGWSAKSKDHKTPSPGKVIAFIVGVQLPGAMASNFTLTSRVEQETSGSEQHPSVNIVPTLADGEVIVGGGATDHWSGSGNLLTCSAPIVVTDAATGITTANGWMAKGKDHMYVDKATITAYAVVLKLTANAT